MFHHFQILIMREYLGFFILSYLKNILFLGCFGPLTRSPDQQLFTKWKVAKQRRESNEFKAI
ncbi:MAG: hypothetical protein CMO98_13625 [Woeseia sp.]|nr:hypothetical protein [Woeseia sp.]